MQQEMVRLLLMRLTGQRYRHQIRRSKKVDPITAPEVMSRRSQLDSAAVWGRSHSSSHSRIAAPPSVHKGVLQCLRNAEVVLGEAVVYSSSNLVAPVRHEVCIVRRIVQKGGQCLEPCSLTHEEPVEEGRAVGLHLLPRPLGQVAAHRDLDPLGPLAVNHEGADGAPHAPQQREADHHDRPPPRLTPPPQKESQQSMTALSPHGHGSSL
jgi:hypothetical protein